MAVRIRKSGKILCAAMHPAEDGDTYIDDNVHYELSVVAKVLITEPHSRHKKHGQWWWANHIPDGTRIASFYKATP